jgi:hypothetical protein
MRLFITGRPERLFLGTALAVMLAALYNLATQQAGVPSSMRYVPPHSTAYVVSAPLQVLWAGLRPHLRAYFAPPPGKELTAAQSVARQVVEFLDEKGIVLREAADLGPLGIDAGAQAALALVDHDGGTHLLLALPVSDRALFAKTVERFTGKPLVEQPRSAAAAAGERGVFRSGSSLVVGFGDDGSALISDSDALVRTVLAGQTENLAYFQSSDWHRRGLSAPPRSRHANVAAWLRGSVRMPALAALAGATNTPVALLGDLQFTLEADDRALDLKARGALPDGRAEAIARLLATPPERGDSMAAVLSRSEAAVTVGDRSLAYFLRYLPPDTRSGPLAGFQRLFPGLLDELRGFDSVTDLSLAASDPLARVPGVVVGLRMAKAEADDLVFHLQSSLRLKRDREVLRLAAKRYRSDNGLAGSAPAAVGALLAAGLLDNRRDPLWPRYSAASEVASPEPALARRDFDNPSYVRSGDAGVVFRYLMPPVTDDDLSYRFTDQKAESQRTDLKQDKYRLCSAFDGGTLWLGNDAEVLGGWLARQRRAPVSSDYADALARHGGLAHSKLNLLLLPRQLLESSQLYPDDTVNKTMRDYLADVQQYRSALLVVTPYPTEREIHVLASFDRH